MSIPEASFGMMGFPLLMMPYTYPEALHYHHQAQVPEDYFIRRHSGETDDGPPAPKRSMIKRTRDAINALLVRLHLKKAP